MSKTIQARAMRGSFSGSVAMVTNLALTILQVPVLLHFWDRDLYGIWLTLLSVVAIISVLDTGHQEYVGNLFNRVFVEDRTQLRSCVSSALRVAALLGAVELVIAAAFAWGGGLSALLSATSAKRLSESQVALMLHALNWWIFGSLGGVVVRLYYPHGRYARAVMWSILMRVAQFAGLVVAASTSTSLLVATLAYCGANALVSCLIFWDMNRLFGQECLDWHAGNLRVGWKHLLNSSALTLNGLLEQISVNGVVLLVSRFLGADSVPLFTTLRTITNIVTQGATVILMPLVPDLTRYQVKREGMKLSATIATSWTLSGSLVNMGVLVVTAFAPIFYAEWTRGALTFDSQLFYPLALAVAARCAMAGSGLYLASVNALRRQLMVTVSRCVTVLALSLALIPTLGLAGAGWAVLAGEIVASFWILTSQVSREMKNADATYPWKSFPPMLVGFAIVAVTLWIAHLRAGLSWLVLGSGIAASWAVAWYHWRLLPASVHERLLSLLPQRFHAAPRP